LSPLLPGTTASDLSIASRVSSENEPLYLPSVWHSAQRARIMGAMSWAKSIDFPGGAAPTDPAVAHTSSPSNTPGWTLIDHRRAAVRGLGLLLSLAIATLRGYCDSRSASHPRRCGWTEACGQRVLGPGRPSPAAATARGVEVSGPVARQSVNSRLNSLDP